MLIFTPFSHCASNLQGNYVAATCPPFPTARGGEIGADEKSRRDVPTTALCVATGGQAKPSKSEGRRRASELGLAGWGVALSYLALLFTTRHPRISVKRLSWGDWHKTPTLREPRRAEMTPCPCNLIGSAVTPSLISRRQTVTSRAVVRIDLVAAIQTESGV